MSVTLTLTVTDEQADAMQYVADHQEVPYADITALAQNWINVRANDAVTAKHQVDRETWADTLENHPDLLDAVKAAATIPPPDPPIIIKG
jgi:hypothetical protein